MLGHPLQLLESFICRYSSTYRLFDKNGKLVQLHIAVLYCRKDIFHWGIINCYYIYALWQNVLKSLVISECSMACDRHTSYDHHMSYRILMQIALHRILTTGNEYCISYTVRLWESHPAICRHKMSCDYVIDIIFNKL